jgi:hypothetical protein
MAFPTRPVRRSANGSNTENRARLLRGFWRVIYPLPDIKLLGKSPDQLPLEGL